LFGYDKGREYIKLESVVTHNDILRHDYLPADRRETFKRRAAVAAALAVTSVGAFYLQHSGETAQLPDVLQTAAESMSHPALGYIGAAMTVMIANGRMKRRLPVMETAFIGGTIANFATERTQDLAFRLNGYPANFLSDIQQTETAKDYAFALSGVALYVVTEKIAHTNKQPLD
jgi:hypothetical protein